MPFISFDLILLVWEHFTFLLSGLESLVLFVAFVCLPAFVPIYLLYTLFYLCHLICGQTFILYIIILVMSGHFAFAIWHEQRGRRKRKFGLLFIVIHLLWNCCVPGFDSPFIVIPPCPIYYPTPRSPSHPGGWGRRRIGFGPHLVALIY